MEGFQEGEQPLNLQPLVSNPPALLLKLNQGQTLDQLKRCAQSHSGSPSVTFLKDSVTISIPAPDGSLQENHFRIVQETLPNILLQHDISGWSSVGYVTNKLQAKDLNKAANVISSTLPETRILSMSQERREMKKSAAPRVKKAASTEAPGRPIAPVKPTAAAVSKQSAPTSTSHHPHHPPVTAHAPSSAHSTAPSIKKSSSATGLTAKSAAASRKQVAMLDSDSSSDSDEDSDDSDDEAPPAALAKRAMSFGQAIPPRSSEQSIPVSVLPRNGSSSNGKRMSETSHDSAPIPSKRPRTSDNGPRQRVIDEDDDDTGTAMQVDDNGDAEQEEHEVGRGNGAFGGKRPRSTSPVIAASPATPRFHDIEVIAVPDSSIPDTSQPITTWDDFRKSYEKFKELWPQYLRLHGEISKNKTDFDNLQSTIDDLKLRSESTKDIEDERRRLYEERRPYIEPMRTTYSKLNHAMQALRHQLETFTNQKVGPSRHS